VALNALSPTLFLFIIHEALPKVKPFFKNIGIFLSNRKPLTAFDFCGTIQTIPIVFRKHASSFSLAVRDRRGVAERSESCNRMIAGGNHSLTQ